MKVRSVIWICFAAYLLGLLLLTHIPAPPSVFEGVSDKRLHFFAYLMLGGLGYTAAALSMPNVRGLPAIAIFIGGLLAMLDESTQPLFNRMADIHDWGADVMGVVVAVGFLSAVRWVTLRAVSAGTSREAAS